MNLEELVTATFMLFVVIDAPGNAPLFYFFTKDLELDRRVRTIRKSILVATGILFFFILAGDLVLKYLGITVDDFKIAGGSILSSMQCSEFWVILKRKRYQAMISQ